MDAEENKTTKPQETENGVYKRNTTLALIIAILSSIIVGGMLAIVSPVAGLYGGYYIWKQRKAPNISSNQRMIHIALFVIWLILYGYFHSQQPSPQ